MTEKQYQEIIKRLDKLEKQTERNRIFIKALFDEAKNHWTLNKIMKLNNQFIEKYHD